MKNSDKKQERKQEGLLVEGQPPACRWLPSEQARTGGVVPQGSHFFGLTKFQDISMIFPGFLK